MARAVTATRRANVKSFLRLSGESRRPARTTIVPTSPQRTNCFQSGTGTRVTLSFHSQIERTGRACRLAAEALGLVEGNIIQADCQYCQGRQGKRRQQDHPYFFLEKVPHGDEILPSRL